jgi:hypothetical protein
VLYAVPFIVYSSSPDLVPRYSNRSMSNWLQALFQVTVAFDIWTMYVLYEERRKYCELPLRTFLIRSLCLSTPATFLVHKVAKRGSVRKAFVAEIVILAISFVHLLSGTLMITQVEICPYSAPLTWKTSFVMLGTAWSGITMSSLAMIASAVWSMVKCGKNDEG